MRLFLLFLIVPLIEIALFVQIGGFIGLGWTLAIVVLTAVIGTYLVRSQGLAVLAKIQSSIGEVRDPTEPLVHGAMILFSGALLLTPGFFTDTVGFLLLIPSVRSKLFNTIKHRITVRDTRSENGPLTPHDTVIEGDFEEIEPNQGLSGWTRH